MDTTLETVRPSTPLPTRSLLLEWGPLALGLLVLFVPTFYRLFTGIWSTEEQAHGPIILGLSLWLMWRKFPGMPVGAQPGAGAAGAGWALAVLSLLCYTLGHSQQILFLEIGSFILMLAAIMLLKFGSAALAYQWFPFFFMLFMLPLPGPLVSVLTMPMKMAVSFVTEHLLYALGYPVARAGVVLQMGQYQLLVADACAGLQTLLTLEALGLFYMNVVRHTSLFRNVALACLIVPISFTANVIRVVVLCLITYYFGDAAGQGFLHGFAGMVLFVTALGLILSIDTFLQWYVKLRQARSAAVGV